MQPYFFAARLSKRHASSETTAQNVHLILLSFVDLLIPVCIPVDVLLIIMAEAIGAGASVIAFVGIAGQLAQGCQNAQAIFDGIKDASGDLRSLHTEVKIFQLTLETFGNILEEVADSGIVVEEKGQALATQLALQYSEEAIEQLLALLAKKNSKHIWGKIRFAIGKDKCAKHVGRMERAKGYILTAQASILL
jgi:hypothetical protein